MQQASIFRHPVEILRHQTQCTLCLPANMLQKWALLMFTYHGASEQLYKLPGQLLWPPHWPQPATVVEQLELAAVHEQKLT